MKSESIRTPSRQAAVWNVWKRNFHQFRRSWAKNLFWLVIEPLFMLLALGYGLGSFVSNINGVSYVEFFFPALLCICSMMVSFFEATYGSYSKLSYQKIYMTMVLTPIEPTQIVIGEILWAASKGLLSAIVVSLFAGLLGHLNNLMLIPAFGIILVSSILFASLGLLVTTLVKNYESIIYPTSGLIVPMSFICGTYFPLDYLPEVLKNLIYLLPLTHAVSAVRGCLLGGVPWWQMLIHVSYLATFAAVCVHFARIQMQKKLIH